jgi:chaperone modulatory protein CbpM
MSREQVVTGVLLEEAAMTLDELARACGVPPQWIDQRVAAGLLGCVSTPTGTICFASGELVRARRLAAIEQQFDANEELAALVVDLIEEVQRLRGPRAG